jgi:hypothetical protein
MHSKVLGAVLGLGIIGGAILAAAPAQAAIVCVTVPNGAQDCYDNGSGGIPPGGTGSTGGGGSYVAPPAPSAPVDVNAAMSRVAVQYNLGSPLRSTVAGLKNGGAYRQYQRGFVVYSPATGAQVSRGAIRTAYAKLGYENGRMGYPTSGELLSANKTSTYQRYQHGTMVWNATDGAHAIAGAIGAKWVASGGANGSLAHPASDEAGLTAGGASQSFQGGAVVWSALTGARISTGAIRATWIKNGAQAGQLGYPVTDERALPLGGVIQLFERGTITWAAKAGTVVTFGVPHAIN